MEALHRNEVTMEIEGSNVFHEPDQIIIRKKPKNDLKDKTVDLTNSASGTLSDTSESIFQNS